MKILSTDGLTKLILLIKSTFATKESLSTVATSGSYSDLSNKPTIPTVDQSYSGSSTNAQSGVAVSNAVATKQDTLVSGTNIKTINNNSILGSGNISVEISIDNTTITKNGSNNLQSVATIDNRSGNAIKTWTGTRAQYDAIINKDSNTLYNITDDTTGGTGMVDINQILTDLNNKADTDMVNVTVSRNFFSGYDFTVSQESISTGQVYTLDLPKTIDPTKYFVNAYAQIITANNGFSIGDIIPWECLWGQNYRNYAFWYNSTALGFGTSDQTTTNNRGAAGTGVGIHSYIRMVFDFYKVRE